MAGDAVRGCVMVYINLVCVIVVLVVLLGFALGVLLGPKAKSAEQGSLEALHKLWKSGAVSIEHVQDHVRADTEWVAAQAKLATAAAREKVAALAKDVAVDATSVVDAVAKKV